MELEKKFTCMCFLLETQARLNMISFAIDTWHRSRRQKIYALGGPSACSPWEWEQ